MIGEGKVIAGWDLALRTMAVGEAVELKVAPSLGYGDEGSPGSTKAETIPPGATLLFTVEFVSIKEGLKSTRAQEDRERLLELRKEREAKAKEASAAKEAKAARAAEGTSCGCVVTRPRGGGSSMAGWSATAAAPHTSPSSRAQALEVSMPACTRWVMDSARATA